MATSISPTVGSLQFKPIALQGSAPFVEVADKAFSLVKASELIHPYQKFDDELYAAEWKVAFPPFKPEGLFGEGAVADKINF